MFKYFYMCRCERSTSGLVAKSNVAIVGPRVRFSAGADSSFSFCACRHIIMIYHDVEVQGRKITLEEVRNDEIFLSIWRRNRISQKILRKRISNGNIGQVGIQYTWNFARESPNPKTRTLILSIERDRETWATIFTLGLSILHIDRHWCSYLLHQKEKEHVPRMTSFRHQ